MRYLLLMCIYTILSGCSLFSTPEPSKSYYERGNWEYCPNWTTVEIKKDKNNSRIEYTSKCYESEIKIFNKTGTKLECRINLSNKSETVLVDGWNVETVHIDVDKKDHRKVDWVCKEHKDYMTLY